MKQYKVVRLKHKGKYFSPNERLNLFLSFVNKSYENERTFLKMLNWAFGKQYQWEYLTEEEARVRKNFYQQHGVQQEGSLENFIYYPRTESEWQEVFKDYFYNLHTNLCDFFKEKIIDPIMQFDIAFKIEYRYLKFGNSLKLVQTVTPLGMPLQLQSIICSLFKDINLNSIKKCNYCESYFYTTRQNKKYCSRECAYAQQSDKRREDPKRRENWREYMKKYMRERRKKRKERDNH